MAQSMAERVAALPDAERDDVLKGVSMEELQWDANFWLRPEQMPPHTDDWAIWLYMAGRGAGKTRAAAEWIREKARVTSRGKLRFALVARTSADVRDTIVEGESGIMSVTPPSELPHYEPSKRRVTWPNGNVAQCFTADEPDTLRGPQFHYGWADEAAAWRQIQDAANLTAWDNLRIAARLGEQPQIIVTTTPKKVKIMRDLIKEAEDKPGRVIVTHGSTIDNAGNLSEPYLDALLGTYAGTRIARQELEGLMLDDVEGALWFEDMIDDHRLMAMPMGLPLRCVGVDPTVAEAPGDECGIVVCSSTGERDLYKRHAFVIEDATVKGSPEVWASAAVAAARRWGAPIIAETNQGGALVKNAIQSVDPSIPVFEVHSKYGKQLRAEPAVLAYEQGRVHHLGTHAELETQMLSWVPGDTKSPDRVDALVHALTALLIKPPPGFLGGSLTARSPARRRIPPSKPGNLLSRGARVYTPARARRRA